MKHAQKAAVLNKSFWMFGGAGLAAACLCASTAFASATIDPDTNILTFDVTSGDETYAQEIPSTVASIVKTGAGKIILTVASTGFTGKTVSIDEGVLEIQHKDALGSGNTVTVENGAQYRMIYNATQNDCGGQNNDIVLKGGAGPDNKGALYGTGLSATTASDYFWGNVTLEGDAAIGCGNARGFGKTLDLNGHTLSLVSGAIRLAGTSSLANALLTVRHPGKIRLVSGTICIQGIPVFEGNGTFEAAGGNIQMWNLANPVLWKLKVEDANLRLQMGNSQINKKVDPLCDVWSGDVVVGSGRTFSLYGNGVSRADQYLTIAGNISGEGAVCIEDSNAEYRLSGANTYSGGTKLGANSNTAGRLRVFADDCVSTNGPVQFVNGTLELHLEGGNITDEYISGLAEQMSSAKYSSPKGSIHFVTGAAQDFTLTSDLSPMHPSISFQHDGAGSLTFSSAMPPGVQLCNWLGNITFAGDHNREVWYFNFATGTVTVAGGTLGRPYYDGNRFYRVGSTNNESSARLRVQDGGKLIFTRATNGDKSEALVVDDTGTKPAILELHEGSVTTGRIDVAISENSKGVVYQYGGDVHHTARAGNDGTIARYGQGYWWMGGGTFAIDASNPYLVLSSRRNAEAQFEVQDGAVTIPGANSLLVGRHSAFAEFYMGGGTASINQIRVGGDLNYSEDKGATAGGIGIVTLSGTNSPTLTTASLRLNERTNEYTSVVNLNAGKLVTPSIADCTLSIASRVNCKSFVNFNGGALKFNGAKDPFTSGLPTRITVFGGGATFEFTQSGDHTPSFSLLAPEGRGIKSITVPAAAAVTGYAMPPVVKISGGGGEDATAHVRFDPRTGTIDRDIEVTSPGINFETVPTVTITAPDMKTPVVCEVELTDEVQEDGGLTLKGSDGTARNFVPGSSALTYNYKGPTVVEAGITLYPRISGVPNPFSTSKELRIAGGAYSAWNSNPSWRRVGGYGTTRAWESNGYYVTDALFFRAQDLEQGLHLNHDTGWINLGEDCVVEIDDFSMLTQRKYTLLTFVNEGTPNYPKGLKGSAPRLADGAPTGWRLRLSSDKKTLRLVHDEGTILLLR